MVCPLSAHRAPLSIGVDFDNTIADYDDVFPAVAAGMGLLPDGFSGGKAAVRASLWQQPGGSERWQRLQGQVYGRYMGLARLFDGVAGFLAQAGRAGAAVFIVSHKSRRGHSDESGTDLREAAVEWMNSKGLFAHIPRERVYFEDDREMKVARIASLDLDVFIDDLPEVLSDPSFPPRTRRLLLGRAAGPFQSCAGWAEVADAVFAS